MADIALKMTRIELQTVCFSIIFRNVPGKTEDHRGKHG